MVRLFCVLLFLLGCVQRAPAAEIEPFAISQVSVTPDDVVLHWESVTDVVYTVSYSEDLVAGVWTPAVTNIAATPPKNMLRLPFDTERFAGLRVEASAANPLVDILVTIISVEDTLGAAQTNYTVQVIWSPDATISPATLADPRTPAGGEFVLWESEVNDASGAYQFEESVGAGCLNGYAYVRVFSDQAYGESAMAVHLTTPNNTFPPPFPNLLLETGLVLDRALP